jgi:hypothetical protein
MSGRHVLPGGPAASEKEDAVAAYAFTIPILPGQEGADRRFFAEVLAPGPVRAAEVMDQAAPSLPRAVSWPGLASPLHR